MQKNNMQTIRLGWMSVGIGICVLFSSFEIIFENIFSHSLVLASYLEKFTCSWTLSLHHCFRFYNFDGVIMSIVSPFYHKFHRNSNVKVQFKLVIDYTKRKKNWAFFMKQNKLEMNEMQIINTICLNFIWIKHEL